MASYLLTNAYLVNEGRCESGSLLIKDGFIEDVIWGKADRSVGTEGYTLKEALSDSVPPEGISSAPTDPLAAGYKTIDLKGAYILPGVIDDQVHFRQPGLTHKGDIESESTAALLGGVTSFMEMPNTKPQTLTQKLLEGKYTLAAEHSRVNYSFYMGCSKDNLDEVLKTDPATVCGIKLFLGSSTGNMLVDDPAYLEALFKHTPTLIAAHCEDETLIRQNTAEVRKKYGENAPFTVHPLIRNAEVCYASSSKAAALARKHGARLHILHISTAKELELLDYGARASRPASTRPLKDAGREARAPHITGEVCVHYLWFTDKDYEKYGAKIKCNPAIKTASDREALRQAVREGKVVVATDHAPHTRQEKQAPYFNCPSGAPWVQHSLSMMLELVHQGIFTLPQVVQALCHRPAELFHIDRRGFLRKGYHADLAIVDPEQTLTVNAQSIAYKCGWSALEGQTLHGKVLYTFINGEPVQKDGQIINAGLRGRRLLFNR